MIEGDLIPAIGIVAFCAVLSQGALMLVIFSMAGIAIGWRVFEDIVSMATLARQAGMFSN